VHGPYQMAISDPRARFVTSIANFRRGFRAGLPPKLRRAHSGPRRFAPSASQPPRPHVRRHEPIVRGSVSMSCPPRRPRRAARLRVPKRGIRRGRHGCTARPRRSARGAVHREGGSDRERELDRAHQRFGRRRATRAPRISRAAQIEGLRSPADRAVAGEAGEAIQRTADRMEFSLGKARSPRADCAPCFTLSTLLVARPDAGQAMV
jgi:hypothetical protein